VFPSQHPGTVPYLFAAHSSACFLTFLDSRLYLDLKSGIWRKVASTFSICFNAFEKDLKAFLQYTVLEVYIVSIQVFLYLGLVKIIENLV
jgi:hypothetical protein